MIRIVLGVATIVAVLTVGITIWFQTQQIANSASNGAVDAPRQYDTKGGQEMRPRWDSSGGRDHDAAGN